MFDHNPKMDDQEHDLKHKLESNNTMVNNYNFPILGLFD